MALEEKVQLLRGNIMKSAIPLTYVVKIKNNIKPKPWFDDELEKLKIDKINKYMIWKNERSDINWRIYTITRNKYNKLLDTKKENSMKNEIIKADKDQNKMWKCIKAMTSNKNTQISDEIMFDGDKYIDPNIICNKFNDFFVKSIIDINNEIPSTNTQFQMEVLNSVFKIKKVQIDDVERVAKDITKKVNKQEYCNSMTWHDAMEYIAFFVTTVINEAIETESVPELWKTTLVTPIPKVRNTSMAGEFRPINSLPADAKMLEIIKEQLVEYLEKNEIIYKNWSAFRKNHSCETTVNYVLNDWMIAKSKGLKTVAVFLDLRRAFETVDREQMTEKLEKCGIKNSELRLFQNNLDLR